MPLRGICRACEMIVRDKVFRFDLIILDITFFRLMSIM